MDNFELKIHFFVWAVKKKIAPPDFSLFLVQIADFGLNYCILKEKRKSTTSGEIVEKGEFGNVGPADASSF